MTGANLKGALAVAFMLGAMAAVGTMDFNVKLAAAEERAERKALRPISHNEARIWSKKCEKNDRQVLASRADDKDWTIHCVQADYRADVRD